MYKTFLKKVLDTIIALGGIILLLPIFVFIMIILSYENKGNPFFIQKRPGKNEKLFSIIKFKTMNDRRGTDGNLLKDEDRLTKFGYYIRKTSLDELPQLINVIKGDMSLIGPRPLLKSYLPLYNLKQKRRHEVKPGITGWSQVNGRNLMLFSKRFEADVWYVDNISLILDIKIFFLTLKNVVSSRGVKPTQNVKDVDDLGFND